MCVVIPVTGHDIILNQLSPWSKQDETLRLLFCMEDWFRLRYRKQSSFMRKVSKNYPLPPKAPLHQWEYPSRPWTHLHIDHAGPLLGHTFLNVVDAHSKWIEPHIVNSTSSEATIKVLRNLFATHGIPEHVVSDNGSGFTNQEFIQFIEHNGIKHTTTSPYHPFSNRLG